MMLLIVELTAKDELAAARAARLLDDYLEALLGTELLKYRIARHASDPSRIVLLEEWTNSAAHAALAPTPAFAALQGELVPLLAEPPRANECEIVAAGVASE